MPTSDNSDGTMDFVAVTAVTTGTLVVTASTLIANLPMMTVTSGNTYTGKFLGRVNDVTKSSATAFLALAPLQITTANVAIAATVGAIINAYAYGGALSTATLMDVYLVPPVTN